MVVLYVDEKSYLVTFTEMLKRARMSDAEARKLPLFQSIQRAQNPAVLMPLFVQLSPFLE
tara:strand:+ start:865 stop:1044 length:180 start_codon:yes stop_codon:yes gene_type:complete